MADYDGDLRLLHHKIDAQTKTIDKIDDKMDTVCDSVSRHDERIKKHTGQIGEIKDKQEKNDLITKWIGGLSAFFGMLWTLALIYLGLKEG